MCVLIPIPYLQIHSNQLIRPNFVRHRPRCSVRRVTSLPTAIARADANSLTGLAFSHLMKFSHKKGFIDRESYVAQYLALALFTTGVARTLGSDDLLAAFAAGTFFCRFFKIYRLTWVIAGTAISWDGHFNIQTEDEVFSSIIDLVLNCGCFIYIGAWMPFNMFNAPELFLTSWRLAIVFLAVLFLRRIPPLLLLYPCIPEITSWKEALFSGHFGTCCPFVLLIALRF